jgi:hypothetical protein
MASMLDAGAIRAAFDETVRVFDARHGVSGLRSAQNTLRGATRCAERFSYKHFWAAE